VFGIGAHEMIIIGLLFLVIIAPGKLPGTARDFGRFVGRRRHDDEFKAELTSTENDCSSESQLDVAPASGQS
jgi:Sec-independent protein translocase protein TatA